MAATTFRHIANRNLNPQHHTQTVVANVIRNCEGRWRGIEPGLLHRNARLFGAYHHNELSLRPLEEGRHHGAAVAQVAALAARGKKAEPLRSVLHTANHAFRTDRPRAWLHPVSCTPPGFALPVATAAEERLAIARTIRNNEAPGEVRDAMISARIERTAVRADFVAPGASVRSSTSSTSTPKDCRSADLRSWVRA